MLSSSSDILVLVKAEQEMVDTSVALAAFSSGDNSSSRETPLDARKYIQTQAVRLGTTPVCTLVPGKTLPQMEGERVTLIAHIKDKIGLKTIKSWVLWYLPLIQAVSRWRQGRV